MGLVDIVLLSIIAVAFALVVRRMRKKGACGSCSSAGSCGGSCAGCTAAQAVSCPAARGADDVARRLGEGVTGAKPSPTRNHGETLV